MMEFLLGTFKKYTVERRLRHAKSIAEVAQILGIDNDIYYLEVFGSISKKEFNLHFKGIYVYAVLQNELFDLEKIKISGLCEKMFNTKDIYIIFVSDYQYESSSRRGLEGPRVHKIHRKIRNLHLVLNQYSKKLVLNKPQYLNYPEELNSEAWFRVAILQNYYNKICDKIPEGYSLAIVSRDEDDFTPYKFKKISENKPGRYEKYLALLNSTISVWFPFDESNQDESLKWYEKLLENNNHGKSHVLI